MDLYEELVHVYLTVVKGWFVLPQAPIRVIAEEKKWEAWPDFLAIDFANGKLVLAEVKKSLQAKDIKKLAAESQGEHRAKVEEGIRNLVPKSALDYGVSWLVVIRDQMVGRYLESGGKAEVITLENVFNEIRDRMP